MSRNPLVSRAAVVAVVALGVVALRHAGIVVPADLHEALVETIAVAAPLVAAYWARRHVTPTASPRADDGTPLAPVAPITADGGTPPTKAGPPTAMPPASDI